MKVGFSAGIWSGYRRICCKKVLMQSGVNWYYKYKRTIATNVIPYCFHTNEVTKCWISSFRIYFTLY